MEADILYHYTDQKGLLGILESRCLWATEIQYLNDAQEFWYAFDIAEREINNRLDQTKEIKVKTKLEALNDEMGTLSGISLFVSSFSQRQDSLSQWRSYVGSQPGFALGFDVSELKRIGEKAEFSLQSCLYQPSEQSQKLQEIIDKAMSVDFNTVSGYVDPDNPNLIHVLKMGGDFLDNLIITAPLLKHTSFEDEKEWRLISNIKRNPNVKFRPGQSMITPYTEIKLELDGYLSSLKQIIIGPSPHKEFAWKSVYELVQRNDLINPKPKIICSNAPYRYW